MGRVRPTATAIATRQGACTIIPFLIAPALPLVTVQIESFSLTWVTLKAGDLLDALVEDLAGVRITDHVGLADHELLPGVHALAGAAVDVHLVAGDLRHGAGPGDLGQLLHEEVDALFAGGRDGLAHVVLLVPAGVAPQPAPL